MHMYVQEHEYRQWISSFAFKLEQSGNNSTDLPKQELYEVGA